MCRGGGGGSWMDCQRGVTVCVHNEHDLMFPGSEGEGGGGGGAGWTVKGE